MPRYFSFVVLAFAVLFQTTARSEIDEPTNPVKSLYASYGTGSGICNHGLTQGKAGALFTGALLSLYSRAVKSGNLDEDFFVQAQDFDLARPIDITSVKIDGTSAEVGATLTQNAAALSGKAKVRIDRFVFFVKREGGSWRIDNAEHDGKTLRHEWEETISNR
jgi:hypothetical protein